MRLRKRAIIAVSAVLILALALSAYGTLAYLTAEGTAHNVITTGGVDIELLDRTVLEKNGEVDTSDFDQVYALDEFTEAYQDGLRIMPGSVASKVVAVRKAEDSAPCWVRVRLIEDLTERVDGEELSFKGLIEPGDVVLNLNEDDWVQQGNWYYYKHILTNTENEIQTTPLFTTVTFSGPGIGNEYVGKTYSIDVYAQAVQSANNEAGGDVLNVQGWPEETVTPEPTPVEP